MSASTYSDLAAHVGHGVSVVSYAGGENIAIECRRCCEVLLDFNRPPTCDRCGAPPQDCACGACDCCPGCQWGGDHPHLDDCQQ
jgi:hypothetical protein